VNRQRHIETVKRHIVIVPFSMWKIAATLQTPFVGREVSGGAFDTRHGQTTLQLQFSK